MAKTIYTERDIEDMARRGAKELAVTDDVYLTDVARERAEKLGIVLRQAAAAARPAGVKAEPAVPLGRTLDTDLVVDRVKADVLAKLGSTVDPVLIDRIVRRVVSQLK